MQAQEEAAAWKRSAATVLDARPILAAGDEPFEQIMLAAGATPSGEALVVIAPFEPAPLYGVLGAQGFAHETRCVTADEWVVRFTRAS